MNEEKGYRITATALIAGCAVAIVELIRAEVNNPDWVSFARGCGVAIAVSLLIFFAITAFDD